MSSPLPKRILVPAVFAYVAFVIAIIGVVIGTLAYQQKPNIENTVNLAAVPSQTDVSGDLMLTGQLRLTALIPATSTDTGGLVVQGGIGCNGSVYAKDGVVTNYVGASSGTLRVGTSNVTGVVLGRSGFPVEVKGNQLIVDGDSKVQNVIPSVSNTYDLGQATTQWRNIYSGGNVYNANLFPTKMSGGIFAQIEDGAFLEGTIDPAASLISNGVFSTPTHNRFPAASLREGDTIAFSVAGDLTVDLASTTLEFLLFINGIGLTAATLVVTELTLPIYNSFVFTVKLSVHAVGIQGTLVGLSCIEWGNFVGRSIGQMSVNTLAEIEWDIRVRSLTLGTGTIRSRVANISKVF